MDVRGDMRELSLGSATKMRESIMKTGFEALD